MDYLFAVDIFQGVAQVAYYLFRQRLVDLPFLDEALKRAAVDPLHYDAVADGRKIDHSEILAYADVTQGEAYVEVFLEQFLIEIVAPVFLLECLVDEESAVLAAAIQFVEPIL